RVKCREGRSGEGWGGSIDEPGAVRVPPGSASGGVQPREPPPQPTQRVAATSATTRSGARHSPPTADRRITDRPPAGFLIGWRDGKASDVMSCNNRRLTKLPPVRTISLVDGLGQAHDVATRLRANVETVVVGKSDQIALVVAALACRGHVLLEDVPGTAKTVLARAVAGSIEGAVVSRIQCTPDLQPTDVTGLTVYDQREREFRFRPGPVFANVLLVDEINRAMPKTQSALLEAMAERQVTVDGVTHPLDG